jgi:hypothetical protein
MVNKVFSRLNYANVMSTIAVFAALGGGAYAAVKLPKNSVGSAQIKSNAVTTAKVKDGSLTVKDFASGQLPAGSAGLKGDAGPQGPAGAAGKDGAAGTNGTDGAPGTARAYGLVSSNGVLSRSKNVVAVTKPAAAPAGTYCIELGASINTATTGLVVTSDYASDSTTISSAPGSNGQDMSIAEWRSNANDCYLVPGTLEVRTGMQSFNAGALVGNVANDEPFFFSVP